jgi:hypothetical protein
MRRLLPILLVALALIAGDAGAARKPKRTIKLRFPKILIAPGANVEGCVFFRVPTTEPFDLESFRIRNHGARRDLLVRHFLVYEYTGERLGEFAQWQRQVVRSRGCIELGPVDRDRRQLVASGAALNSRGILPQGLALPLEPVPAMPGGPVDGIGILLDGNWVNQGRRTRAVSGKVILSRAKPGTVRRRLRPILERSAEAGILVPPFEIGTTEDHVDARWRPGADVCLYNVTGKLHRRGLFLGVDVLDADGQLRNPSTGGIVNPFDAARYQLYGAPDWTDSGSRTFRDGFLVRADESVRVGCWHDNGTRVPVRLGCEEVAGEPPGSVAVGPAKPCTIVGPDVAECPAGDPAYPERTFTGRCVAANLVAGSDPDDEVCALAGFYYDAVPGVPSDSACDLAGAGVIE